MILLGILFILCNKFETLGSITDLLGIRYSPFSNVIRCQIYVFEMFFDFVYDMRYFEVVGEDLVVGCYEHVVRVDRNVQ